MISISAAIAAAILLPSLAFANSATFDASYDDLTTLPANGITTPVGIYKGLSYSGFIVAAFSELNLSASGVIPHSDPNVALAAFSSTPPALTAKYSGSKTKSFSLTSFYYGCDLADENGVVSSARACNITVLGYKAGSSKPAANQTFIFKPLEEVDVMNPPTHGTFSAKFTGLQSASFVTQPSSLTATIIDDLIGSTVS